MALQTNATENASFPGFLNITVVKKLYLSPCLYKSYVRVSVFTANHVDRLFIIIIIIFLLRSSIFSKIIDKKTKRFTLTYIKLLHVKI